MSEDEVRAHERANRIDLGDGHFYFWRRLELDDGTVLRGLVFWHPHKWGEGTRDMEGWLPIDKPHGWDLISEDPLHIEPSIQCNSCPDHGWIRDGKWVSA